MSAVKKERRKDGRKYVLIRPKLSQTLVNEGKTGIIDADSVRDLNSVTLGVSDDSVWGKRFLIRFKSKQSGRILEVKLGFDNQFVKTG
jgi:hypothetical protein